MNSQGLSLDQAPPLHLPLRFFLTAPLFGMAAGLLLIWRGGQLLQTPWAFQTIALAHLITLGFISMVMMGALYQIIPVFVGTRIPFLGLAHYVHLGLCAGLSALVGGVLMNSHPLLWLALAALLPVFLIFVGQLAVALARAPARNVTVYSIGLSVTALALAVSLGLLFLWHNTFGWPDIDRRALTSIHIYLALGGWVGALITGVGQVLIPMFYLSTSFPNSRNWFVLACQALVLISGAMVAFLASSSLWHLLPLFIASLAVAVFTSTVLRLLRGRKRRITDTTLRFWQVGLTL